MKEITQDKVSRRRFLAVTATVSVLSGCLGGTESNEDGGSSEDNASKKSSFNGTSDQSGTDDGTQDSDSSMNRTENASDGSKDADENQSENGGDKDEDKEGDINPRKKAKKIIELLREGKYETVAGMVTSRLRQQAPPSKLKKIWEKFESNGEFSGIESVEEKDGTVVLHFSFGDQGYRGIFRFNSKGKISTLLFRPAKNSKKYTPPEYAEKSSFVEKEVTVNEGGDCEMPATLTMPKNSGEVPGVVLVHGTGPHDRDETIGSNKPFKDLAWGLASRGVAVLRYEKRTHACGVQTPYDLNDLTVKDAVSAVELMHKQDRVEEVFVLGHSQGGYAGPRIAERVDVSGLVLMAAPSRHFADLIVDQQRYSITYDGKTTEKEKNFLENVKQKAKKAKNPENLDPEKKILKFPGAFWKDIDDYDPADKASKLDVPIMVLHGRYDFQVYPEDYKKWKKHLSDARFEKYAVNHIFIPAEKKGTQKQYNKPGNIPLKVIEDIVGWITSNEASKNEGIIGILG